MKFNETGLPSDPLVMNAFSSYQQNAEAALPPGAPPEALDEMPLRSAQVLHAAGAETSLLVFALLSGTPPETWGLARRRFGDELADNLEQAQRHQNTGFAYIEEAPVAVQQLALATGIVTFQAFEKLADEAIEGLEGLKMGIQPANGLNLPMLPDARIFEQIARKTDGMTGNDALETRYARELADYKFKNDTLLTLAQDMSLPLPPPSGMPGAADPSLRYPSFESTELLDDPKVRAVYDVLLDHGRVTPEEFEAALSVGTLLSKMTPDKNPLTVAAGLLDVALPGMGPDDFTFLDKKIDWDVLDLVRDNTVYNVPSPGVLLKAPVEFRQIALANAISTLTDAQKGAEELMAEINSQPRPVPPQVVAANLRPLAMMAVVSERVVGAAADMAEAPEMAKLFREKLTSFKAFLQNSMPKPQQARSKHIATFEKDDDAPHDAPTTAQPKKHISSFEKDEPQPPKPKSSANDAGFMRPKKGSSFDL
jgi:hypothetical protein